MNFLRQKLGPLELWVWLALITAALLGWWLYEQHKNGSGSAASGSASDTAPEVVVDDGSGNQQSTTPPGNELTAAQEAELARLPGEVTKAQDTANEAGAGARKALGSKAPPKKTATGKKPGPVRKTDTATKPAAKPAGKPAGVRSVAKTAKASGSKTTGTARAEQRPGVTAARHLATSHATSD